MLGKYYAISGVLFSLLFKHCRIRLCVGVCLCIEEAVDVGDKWQAENSASLIA